MELVIDARGDVRAVYDDALDLAALGRLVIARASHVEPNAPGAWTADLTPVGGPQLGPFAKRREALSAEVAWLRRHWLGPSSAAAEPSEA